MNFLAQIFGGAGASVLGQDISQITDYAEIAYAVVVGLLLVIAGLLAAILVWGVAVGK